MGPLMCEDNGREEDCYGNKLPRLRFAALGMTCRWARKKGWVPAYARTREREGAHDGRPYGIQVGEECVTQRRDSSRD